MLSIRSATKRYGKHVALDNLSLEVPEGMIFGLLGPNGAGKTTLLRCVMGLLQLTEGEIRIFGDKKPGSAEVRSLLGYMPQQLAIYPVLTAAENVRFFGRLYGVPESELERRTNEILERVELADRTDTHVGNFSGGQARRVMLATTLIHRPRLLILDEPTAGVDPLLRVKFWGWFRELVAEGTSIIITTHHISEAAHCQQVVFQRHGTILESGTPDELMQRYGAKNLEDAFVHATEAREVGA
jgi:ABC-2 type transport system ATP-binding protein